MKYKHFLGEFDSLQEVWKRYPSGGQEGDFLIINGETYPWNTTTEQWAIPDTIVPSSARSTQSVFGDLNVENDLNVGGVLNARLVRGRNAFCGLYVDEAALLKRCPKPLAGQWALIMIENRTDEDGNAIGRVYVCKEDGQWEDAGYNGGFDNEGIMYLKREIEEESKTRRAIDSSLQQQVGILDHYIDGEVSERKKSDSDLQNQIDSLQIHGMAVSNEFGDDPHIGISQAKLTEKFDETDERIEDIERHTPEVVPMPDEEDLTLAESEKIKFANKAYNPDNYSGMGRVYLRKNITDKVLPFDGFVGNVPVEPEALSIAPAAIKFDSLQNRFVGADNLINPRYYSSWPNDDKYVQSGSLANGDEFVNMSTNKYYAFESGVLRLISDTTKYNLLTQDMFCKDGPDDTRVPNTNTIFVIRYGYELAEDITVPANCVLEFDGGSVSGAYTITGQNTAIVNNENQIFTNVLFAGTFYTSTLESSWFNNFSGAIINSIKADKYLFDSIITSEIVISRDNIDITSSKEYIEVNNSGKIKILSNNVRLHDINFRCNINVDEIVIQIGNTTGNDSKSNIELYNLILTNTVPSKNCSGIVALGDLSNLKIYNCKLYNFGDAGRNQSGMAINVEWRKTPSAWEDPSAYADLIPTNVSISNCIVDTCYLGISCSGGLNCTIKSCKVVNAFRAYMLYDHFGIGINIPVKMSLEYSYADNVINGCLIRGYDPDNTTGVHKLKTIVSNNVFNCIGGANCKGLDIISSFDDSITIENNKFYNFTYAISCNGDAITDYKGTLRVINNIFERCPSVLDVYTNIDTVNMLYNIIRDCASAGYYVTVKSLNYLFIAQNVFGMLEDTRVPNAAIYFADSYNKSMACFITNNMFSKIEGTYYIKSYDNTYPNSMIVDGNKYSQNKEELNVRTHTGIGKNKFGFVSDLYPNSGRLFKGNTYIDTESDYVFGYKYRGGVSVMYDISWSQETNVNKGTLIKSDNNVYLSLNSGTLGTTPPSGTSTQINGNVNLEYQGPLFDTSSMKPIYSDINVSTINDAKALTNVPMGFCVFVAGTVNKPIYKTSSGWVDATGTPV